MARAIFALIRLADGQSSAIARANREYLVAGTAGAERTLPLVWLRLEVDDRRSRAETRGIDAAKRDVVARGRRNSATISMDDYAILMVLAPTGEHRDRRRDRMLPSNARAARKLRCIAISADPTSE